jgi:branched-chain amino acid transport system substrate-binding protein
MTPTWEKRARRSVSGLAVAAAAFAVASCGSKGDTGSASTGSSGEGVIPIGMIWSMSGNFSPYGQPGVDGVKLAIDEVNKSGGVKVDGKTYKMQLKLVDDRSDAQAAVAGATQLIKDDKVKVIIGPISGLTPPVAKLAAANHVIQLNAAAVANALAGTKDYPLIFGTLPTGQARCGLAAQAIKDFFPNTKSTAIVGPSDPTGQNNLPFCMSEFKKLGLGPKSFPYPPGTKDLTTTMTKVAAAKPDAISTGWSAPDAQNVFSAVGPAGIKDDVPMLLYGTSYDAGVTGFKGGRPFIAHPIVVSDFTVPNPTPQAQAFADKLKTFLKTDKLDPLETTAEFFYDPMKHLAESMKQANTVTDTQAIADKMNSITTEGITGPTRFVNGNIQVGVDVTESKDGQATTKHITFDSTH